MLCGDYLSKFYVNIELSTGIYPVKRLQYIHQNMTEILANLESIETQKAPFGETVGIGEKPLQQGNGKASVTIGLWTLENLSVTKVSPFHQHLSHRTCTSEYSTLITTGFLIIGCAGSARRLGDCSHLLVIVTEFFIQIYQVLTNFQVIASFNETFVKVTLSNVNFSFL